MHASPPAGGAPRTRAPGGCRLAERSTPLHPETTKRESTTARSIGHF
ncbi:MAG: hypothetical protein IT378_12715 [Sandaracinaceae bacterium]|nr:hypothetical protein [Sandaracinaceae bacterium]